MHGERDPRSLDEGVVRSWLANGRDFLRAERQNMADFGRAIRMSGLSDNDAAAAISRAMSEGIEVDEIVEALRRGQLQP
jgi:hypothetical protein